MCVTSGSAGTLILNGVTCDLAATTNMYTGEVHITSSNVNLQFNAANYASLESTISIFIDGTSVLSSVGK